MRLANSVIQHVHNLCTLCRRHENSCSFTIEPVFLAIITLFLTIVVSVVVDR